MTRRLEKAIAEISRLNKEEQDAIASWLLAELDDERAWNEQFRTTESQLGRWAQQVREDVDSGRTKRMDLDEL